jgi:uncharacterized protein
MKANYRKLLNDLQENASGAQLPLETVEQDYAISYLLAALAQIPELSEVLVFRGGTALRKCFFENYRYSKDLDYSVRGSLPLSKYNHLLDQGATTAREVLDAVNAPNNFDVSISLVQDRDEHNDQQDFHKFVVKFPWHLEHKGGRAGRTIKLDTSHSEPVVLPPEKRKLIHRYDNSLDILVNCAALEEILAEKYVAMCGVAQQRERQERVFTRPRDYFDLSYALDRVSLINKENFLAAITIKAERRGIEIRPMSELASSSSIAALDRDWEPFLGDVVSNLPGCHDTLKTLEKKMEELFPDFAKSLASSNHATSFGGTLLVSSCWFILLLLYSTH